ncbi:ATP-binding protein [Aliivibrio sp. S4TY2]|uniref:ATP-binding protein n=1 Tax=unclassified Aliivibrio TaxID=2645654 RepID=UPI0023797130|nr:MULTISPECIES: ATP-binding protein [unclassified Aliivibrio]MDD9157575.1 ATP-binding protein [Aliivibrio sp. S4TY2]MDD9161462.1 ATP-binding protein [Aliivibrio sp. S4TY1]MDD9165485.1 ATP-binding protein [Aliivibrio sp. S4MY2]MDD9169491.1 ATP-binding protein [Aliivibrio sp. S4MY4]MDD9186484.1 ATP-binding protein [Aliivibrio sp. S4MY3]
MKDHAEKEQLQEALLELKRSKERESHLYKENQAILNGLSAISDAQNKEDIFNSLLVVIKKFIHFDNAFVISSSDEKCLSVLASTDDIFNDLTCSFSDLFYRACHNESIILFKPKNTQEFSSLPPELKTEFSSVAISGIQSSSGHAVIVLTSRRFGEYSASTKNSLQRFTPLIERAVIDIDYKHRLQSLVDIKTKALHLSKQRFQDFANTVGDWFWETDINFNFSYLAGTKINDTKMSSQNLLGLIESESIRKQILAAKHHNKSFNELEWCPEKLNNKVWFSLSGTPYYDEFGVLTGYRGTAKDISARKKRITEIHKAKVEAEKANRAKSQFLAMMSHEIRTPLNAILGMIDVFSGSHLSFEQRQWLEQMETSSQLLLTIISDVLDISRIESETFILDEQPIDLIKTIHSAIDYFKVIAQDKGINLTVTVSRSVPVNVIADQTRIAQIIFNLVGNAVKFTNNGAVCLNISLFDGNLICFSIKDTGIGIARDITEQLFKPFIQADSSITRQFGGTGLGLSITKRLTELMNGTIEVESLIGEGSTFTVKLPLKEAASISRKLPINELIPEISKQYLSVLVAEDNKANQAVMKLLLERQGHQVTLVKNGVEVIQEWSDHNNNYDVILMDVSMPIKDGISATKEIRATGSIIPIVAITGHALCEEKKLCIDAGMNDFVSKPIRAKQLKAVLRSLNL